MNYLDKHTNLSIFINQKYNQKWDYKFIVQSDCGPYRAFRTISGLKWFLKRYNLKIQKEKVFGSMRRIIGAVEYIYFYDIKEVPAGLVMDSQTCNGQSVPHFFEYQKGITRVYRPNPNSNYYKTNIKDFYTNKELYWRIK